MKTKERLELAGWVVGEAKKNGADEAAVDISNSRTVDIEHRDHKLDKLQESTENSLSLSVYAKNKYSNHTTNDLRRESLSKFVSEAVSMTKYLSEDPYRKLPDPKYYDDRQEINLKLYDSSVETVTSEERVKMARDLEELAMSKSDQIVACTTYYSDTEAESAKINSNGFEGSRRTTSFGYGLETTMKDDKGGRPSDWAWGTVRMKRDIRDADLLVAECIQRNKRQIGQTKMASGKYRMLVENRAGSRLLYAMQRPLSGRSLQQKSSFLEGKLGEKIGSEKMTIYDDPFVINGHGSRLYDTEGRTTKKRVIFDKGILKSYYIGTYYANKMGVEPTLGTPTNITFEYGNKSLKQLIEQISKGILVTAFVGGNSNGTTGDYSYGIVGMYIENGQLVKPVNEMNISGNLADLWSSLIEIGNDPYIYSSYRRPSLLFDDIQFSGL
jgi:PmbA protein